MIDRIPLIVSVMVIAGLDLLMLNLFDVIDVPPWTLFAIPITAVHLLAIAAFWPRKK